MKTKRLALHNVFLSQSAPRRTGFLSVRQVNIVKQVFNNDDEGKFGTVPNSDESLGRRFRRFQGFLLLHPLDFRNPLDDVLLTLPPTRLPSFQILRKNSFWSVDLRR